MMKDRLWVALDVASAAAACALIDQLHPFVGGFKVGLELVVAQEARPVLEHARRHGCRTFLDLKLHDIPQTVSRALRSAEGADFVNVHALAGAAALQAAVAAAPGRVLAVTVLTSLEARDLLALGFDGGGCWSDAEMVAQAVRRLAGLAARAGVRGLVCAPQDVASVRTDGTTVGLTLVTPGIRPTWTAAGDQKRFWTPAQAVAAGADFLVVGRPITHPPEGWTPAQAAQQVVAEMEATSPSVDRPGSGP